MKKWMSENPLLTLVIVFILVLALGIPTLHFGKTNNEPTTATPTNASTTPIATNIPTTIPTVAKPQSLEDKIRAALPADLQKDTKIEMDSAYDLKTFQNKPGNLKEITLTVKYGDVFWDLNSVKQATWRNSTTIIKSVFPVDTVIDSLVIINQIPITDTYGKKSVDMLDTISISRDTYSKIVFASFDYNNLPKVADDYAENQTIK